MRAQDRDQDISDLRQVGVRRCDVARRFGLSAHQVRRIELRHQTPPPPAHTTNLLREAIRAADDPQKPWPAVDLVHTLAILPATRRVLLAYLDRTGTRQLTLLALMDLVLMDKGERTVNMQNSALLAMPGIATKGYRSAAKALTALDMGSKGNAIWRKRIASHQGKWRITLPPAN
jgi:transposase-like protein